MIQRISNKREQLVIEHRVFGCYLEHGLFPVPLQMERVPLVVVERISRRLLQCLDPVTHLKPEVDDVTNWKTMHSHSSLTCIVCISVSVKNIVLQIAENRYKLYFKNFEIYIFRNFSNFLHFEILKFQKKIVLLWLAIHMT